MAASAAQTGGRSGLPGEVQKAMRRLFGSTAKQPASWFHTGVNLMECAEVLWEGKLADADLARDPISVYTYGPVYTMLVGFAMENMLKGLAIAKDPGLIKAGTLAKELRTHDLGKLWELAGLKQLQTIRPRLERITSLVTAFGRCPVSLTENQMLAQVNAWMFPDRSGIRALWRIMCREGCRNVPDWVGWSECK
jgi:hypothetical protein